MPLHPAFLFICVSRYSLLGDSDWSKFTILLLEMPKCWDCTGVSHHAWIIDLIITILGKSLTLQLRLAWNSLCRTDGFPTHGDPPTSPFQVLGLKVCTTMPSKQM